MVAGIRAWPLAAALAACSAQELVTLGDKDFHPYQFETPHLVTELAASDRTDNPTLTGDLLEIYFTSDRAGGGDLWFARRDSASAVFHAATTIAELNSAMFETSAAISSDGLTLWFGSDRGGGVGSIDIWVSTRANRTSAWMPPANVVALNTTADEIPRPPGLHQTVMPMSSTRASMFTYQTYFAARPSRGAPFASPAAIPDLAFTDRSTVDAFLSDDGLTLFYSSVGTPGDGVAPTAGDLYVAWRRSLSERFSFTQPLVDLNTAGDERDPWLTPDGKTLYFTSDRDGVLNIYTAAVKPR